MQQGTLMIMAVLATALAAASAEHDNLATAKESCAFASKLVTGKVLDPEKINEIATKFSGYYAPRISCRQTPNSDFGQSLENATFGECAAVDPVGRMITFLDWPCEKITLVPGTGGKQVLQASTCNVRTRSGQTFKLPYFNYMTFGDDGKIVAYDNTFDTAPLDFANVASLKKWLKLSRDMIGETISKAHMAELAAHFSDLHAPKINCSVVPSSAQYGFALSDATFSECGARIGATFAGYKFTPLGGDIAPIAGSMGKKLVLTMAYDVETPGRESVHVPCDFTFAFDDAGKIVASEQRFDTAILSRSAAAVRAVGLAAEQPHGQAPLPVALGLGSMAGAAILGTVIVKRWRERPHGLLEGYEKCDA